MYSLGGLCIVWAGTLPAGFGRACGGGIFFARGTGAGGWWQGENMLVPTLDIHEKSGYRKWRNCC